MKKEEIFKTYKDKWVLIECEQMDENFEVIEGKILYHSKDKDDVYKKLLELRPKDYVIEYTGQIPEDLAVML